MSSLSDSDYRCVVGESYYKVVMKLKDKEIEIPPPEIKLTEWYKKQMQSAENGFPNSFDQVLRLQEEASLPRSLTMDQVPPPVMCGVCARNQTS